jgi:hypothetical protein
MSYKIYKTKRCEFFTITSIVHTLTKTLWNSYALLSNLFLSSKFNFRLLNPNLKSIALDFLVKGKIGRKWAIKKNHQT